MNLSNVTRNSFDAFYQGIQDGIEQPHDLTSGMSYNSDDLCEMYDQGANLGQLLGRIIERQGVPDKLGQPE